MHRSVLRGIVLTAIAGAVVAGLLLIPSPSKKKQHPPNNDPWLLVSYDPDNPYGTYLGNGFISTRIMGDGVGSQDGKPLPCYMAGLYDDEKLIPTPTWSDLRFYDGKTRFVIDKDADYKQVLNMKSGILTTHATWRAGRRTLKGKVEVIVSRARPNIAIVRATLRPSYEGGVAFRSRVPAPAESQLTSLGAQRTDDGVTTTTWRTRSGGTYIAVSDLSLVSAGSIGDRPGSRTYVNGDRSYVTVGTEVSALRLISVASASDAEAARAASLIPPLRTGADVARLMTDHERAWAGLWKKDIIIDGPARDQQVIHSCMFYLLQSVREGSPWSIPPMGLSNNAFSGHVFWDADTWMFPALIWQHPELAKSIVEYRYRTLPGAMANAKAHGFAGAEYAWESGYTGKEDTPEGLVYRHERHINGDVALAQWQYYLATNDLTWLRTRGFPVIKATADYWVSRVTLNKGTDRYEIHKVVPPDENADLVNNSVYTNAIAKLNLEIAARAAKLVGASANPKWADVAARMYIPFDQRNNRFIPFDGYKGYDAKQADVELLAYPLQFSFAGQDMTGIYRNTLRYYAPKVLANGPAMTSSAHAVIAARLGDSAGAYEYWRKSWTPYLRGPHNYFNEKKSTTVDNMCFLTGAAGPIQSILFGFAGLRMDYLFDGPMGPSHIESACLPKQWKSMKITGVQWQGTEYTLRLTQGGKPLSTHRNAVSP